ncbi:ATP-binding protein [Pseudanabaena sp. FACHB-1277]|uniref:ATP-binding protein n=1 Tax=Pseudanabaena cinerea FACHB-1277 TaxID=2949581 RepID=A0A926UTI6_9CYAN|nr:ATP-binding protein [Pseudanabaena cinerea]MBD2149800.1 ATP-binding protein [Pseudanabaena cinerea FACHB-1277]
MLDETRQSIYEKQVKLASLLLYQNMLAQEVWETYERLLQCLANYALDGHEDHSRRLCYLFAYGRWFRAIASTGYNWRNYVISQILSSDNPFSQKAQASDIAQLPPSLVAAAKHDLKILEEISLWGGYKLIDVIESFGDRSVTWQLEHSDLSRLSEAKRSLMLKFQTTDDWTDLLPDLVSYYQNSGTGIFTEYDAFRWHNGHLEGIAYPDLVQLTDIIGYESQRQALYKNTEAFLSGYPALHTLLYGSRGTGKSSMVKSLIHAYGDRNLRLIEVAKDDLQNLPAIAEMVREVPQKFIIFVDDLSFEEENENYKALKVILEGNLSARPHNLLVYATSNRRHLLREYFSDRPSLKDLSERQEVNPWDTVQEKLSLSDRFGLTLTFLQADQEIYLKIVHHLAKRAQLQITEQELNFRALQWATRNNGQSGRTAQQFVNFLQADLAL